MTGAGSQVNNMVTDDDRRWQPGNIANARLAMLVCYLADMVTDDDKRWQPGNIVQIAHLIVITGGLLLMGY